jgi:hypothetical protein
MLWFGDESDKSTAEHGFQVYIQLLVVLQGIGSASFGVHFNQGDS